MVSYNLEDGAQLWYYQIQWDDGTPSWHRFKEILHLRYGPPLSSNPLASWQLATDPTPWKSTRIGSRP